MEEMTMSRNFDAIEALETAKAELRTSNHLFGAVFDGLVAGRKVKTNETAEERAQRERAVLLNLDRHVEFMALLQGKLGKVQQAIEDALWHEEAQDGAA
jgi:hypothetical protein